MLVCIWIVLQMSFCLNTLCFTKLLLTFYFRTFWRWGFLPRLRLLNVMTGFRKWKYVLVCSILNCFSMHFFHSSLQLLPLIVVIKILLCYLTLSHCIFLWSAVCSMCSCHTLDEPQLYCLLYFYARKQLLLSARLSHRNSVSPSVSLSVCPSVTRVDQSKTVQARITKS